MRLITLGSDDLHKKRVRARKVRKEAVKDLVDLKKGNLKELIDIMLWNIKSI